MCFFPLIQNDSIIHMHGLVVYVKEGLPFTRDVSLENFADSYLCFQLALLHSVSNFFFLYWSPCFYAWLFDSTSSNIDEVFSNNHLTIYLSVETLTLIKRIRLPILVDLKDLVNSVITSNYLTQMITFLLGSLTVTLTILLFWIYLFLLTRLFALWWLSSYWEILIMLLSQFPMTFHQTQNRMPHFIA